MVSLSEVRASNTQLTRATTPRVAVFVGATDGIGKSTLTQLASTKIPIKVYIIGRDEAKHRHFVNDLCALNKEAEIIYLQGQVSLMAEAKRLSDEIMRSEQWLDLLFLSAGFLPFLGRQETAEGFELATAVAYYSRHVFIRRLLPLLRAASQSVEALYLPRVVNILGTGHETANLFFDDLMLKEPGHFSIPNFVTHCGTMTTTSLNMLAEKGENQGIVFMHNHPGVVTTDLLRKSWGDKWDGVVPRRMSHGTYVTSTPLESGERSLFLITSAKYGGEGVPIAKEQVGGKTVKGTLSGSLFCVDDDLETRQIKDLLDEIEQSGAADKIWKHTEDLLGAYL